MNAKIERVNRDIEKTKGKISDFQTRLKELEAQKTELENLEIIGTVRGLDISLTELAALLKQSEAVTTPGQSGPKSVDNKEEQ